MDPDRLAEIPVRMQEFVDDGRIAGAVMVLARSDGIALLEAVGFLNLQDQVPMPTDAIFRMASVAKPMTATGIMVLQEEGRLSIQAPLERYLPEFEGLDAEGAEGPVWPIWIQGLMTHTSGMAAEWELFEQSFFEKSLAEVVATYAQRPLQSVPGTRFVYSSPGFDVLGRVIEVVSGKRFEDFMEERIFHPLGMSDSGFFVPIENRDRLASFYRFEDGQIIEGARPNSYAGDLPHDGRVFPAPAFGFYSTAPDLAALLQMLLNSGQYDGRRLLSPASITAMTVNQVLNEDLPAWGLGWTVADRAGSVGGHLASAGAFGHGGSTGVGIWADPENDLAGAFLIHQSDQESSYVQNIFMTMAYAALIPVG
jgi:CubicO group peptidase (beta-lactamase class C family)